MKSIIFLVSNCVFQIHMSTDAPFPSGQGITVEVQNDGICTIWFDRPQRKNAITTDMMVLLPKALQYAAQRKDVVVTVISGKGDFYCSGNDLSNFLPGPNTTFDPKEMAGRARDNVLALVSAFIDFPKVLVAAVNGPAIGVAVTTMLLCDLVYASDNATFHTPFVALAQSAEAASSFLFPYMMGLPKANDLLLCGRRLDAKEAFERNMLTAVIPASEFHKEVRRRCEELAKFSPNVLAQNKKIVRSHMREALHEVNRKECDVLYELWQSDDLINALTQFFQRQRVGSNEGGGGGAKKKPSKL